MFGEVVDLVERLFPDGLFLTDEDAVIVLKLDAVGLLLNEEESGATVVFDELTTGEASDGTAEVLPEELRRDD